MPVTARALVRDECSGEPVLNSLSCPKTVRCNMIEFKDKGDTFTISFSAGRAYA
jgi:hypothetical protein